MRGRGQAIGAGVRLGGVSQIVDQVFALQSQDFSAAALGLRARGPGLTMRDVSRAVETERAVVRGWLMRGTLHTVPGPDYRWLVGLLGPLALQASARRYRELGLDEALCARAEGIIEETLTARGAATRAELTSELAALGIDTHGQIPFHLIRRSALRGRICFGPDRLGEAAFVLLDEWLPPSDVDGPSGPDAVVHLARRYLRAYAPAAVEDFAAWSGLPRPAARRAWQALGTAGETVPCTVLGQECAVPAERAAEFEEPPSPAGDVRLLPMYDNYLLGYRTRAVAVPPADERRVRPGGGQIRATVTVDGQVLGTWSRKDRGRALDISLFDPASLSPEDLADETADVIRFLATTA